MYTISVSGNRRGFTGAFQSAFCGASVVRPVAYRYGIFIEHYCITAINGDHITACYDRLERSGAMARHFDPKRLPD